MAIQKQVLITCDAPDCEESIAVPGGDSYAATQAAKKAGWEIKKDQHTCPASSML